MKLPKLSSRKEGVAVLSGFLGLNKKYVIGDAEWSDTVNITNDYFPVLGNRRARGLLYTLKNPQGFLGGKYLAYVDDNVLYYNEEPVHELEATDSKRLLVMMGAYLVAFPDGYVYNTYTEEGDTIENRTSAEGVEVTLCKLDGTAYNASNTVISATEPSDRTKYWIDTSQDDVVIKAYSSTYSQWTAASTTYVKFEAPGIGKGFAEYDAVNFEGVDTGEWCYNGYDFNTDNIIYACGDDYLIVAGLISLSHTVEGTVTFKRKLPEMDYICEQDNRIWGCSSSNHEIYACKQGDPHNWYFYAGLDSDSYAATVGSEDVFTGAAAYGGYVYFLKEGGWHKLYGDRPSNYQMVWKPGRGVQKGSELSLALVGEYLMWKARDGVVMYDGSTELVSEALGADAYYDAVAGAYRNKYYVAMRDKDYNYRLYVYDTARGTWIAEDGIRAKYMAHANDGFHIVKYDGQTVIVNNEAMNEAKFPMREEGHYYPNGDIYPGDGIRGELEDVVEWSFETGDIGLSDPYHKYLKRIFVRLWLDEGTRMRIHIMYDSSDEWSELVNFYSTKKRSYEIPAVVQRCDHCRIRFSGYGNFRLYSIAKQTEEGSGTDGSV